jgi:hypothetical protein
MNTKYPNIEVQLTEQDSNAFAIIGRVNRALEKAKIPKEECKQFMTEAMSGDYDNVIQTAMKWVTVK